MVYEYDKMAAIGSKMLVLVVFRQKKAESSRVWVRRHWQEQKLRTFPDAILKRGGDGP